MSLQIHHAHSWDLTPAEAIALQKALRAEVRVQPLPGRIHRVGGVDVSYRRGVARAAAVVLAFPSLEVVQHALAEVEVTFPYVPGLLSFRELPALLAAIEQLEELPDVWLCDAHGYAHPRRFGLACHLGVLLDMPSVGCAKSILVGKHAPLGEARGGQVPLLDGGEVVGAAVRTRARVKPVYVSVGHRADLESAVRLVLDCGRGLRIPEPTRLAHHLLA